LRIVLDGADGKPLRRLSALRDAPGVAPRDVRFAMNAGMYDAAGAPVGLLVEDGRERRALNVSDGAGNFYLRPNGVLLVDANGGRRSSRVRLMRRPISRRAGRRNPAPCSSSTAR
jgi:uncharacterized protein YigE (DUF2233 family)